MNEGEIWVIELPFKNGNEQRGKRPGIILANTKTNMVLTIPITSNRQALRFPNTLEIEKSDENGLDKNSIALIFQIQSLDKRRFINKIGKLEESYTNKIKNKIKEMCNI